MRRAARKDLVHAPIVAGLRLHGIRVEDMPQPGDILCYGMARDPGTTRFRLRWIPMELKSPKAIRNKKQELTPAQATRAKTMPIPVVHSLAEALALFGLGE